MFSSLGFSKHAELLTSQCHTASWFSSQGVDSIVETQVGARAGNPLADLRFNHLMVHILNDIERVVVDCNLLDLWKSPRTSLNLPTSFGDVCPGD